MKGHVVAAVSCVALSILACSLTRPGSDPPTSADSSPAAPGPTAAPTGATPTAAPLSVNPQGPYVLFEGEGGIWIANPDGSFLTRLSDSGVGAADLHRALSPQGDALAFISSSEHGPVLVRIGLPDGSPQVLATLQNVIPDDIPIESLTAEAFAYFVITQFDNVAWEPGEGGRLAFVGAMDGPTADLYLYDPATRSVSRLTDGPSQAFYPSWSPDGAYVLHFGGSFIEPFGGAIIGPTRSDGAWAVRPADGEVIRQPETVSYPHNLVGWQADGRYLLSANDECGRRDFVAVDPETAAGATVLAGCHGAASLSPDGNLLFGSPACEACPWGEGAFLLPPEAVVPIRVWDEQAWEIDWLEEGSVFSAYPLGLVTSDGGVRVDRPGENAFEPAISPGGRVAWKVIDGPTSVIEIGRRGAAAKVVVDLNPESMIWAPGEDETLLVAADDGGLYALMAPDFVPRRVGEFGGDVRQATWVP